MRVPDSLIRLALGVLAAAIPVPGQAAEIGEPEGDGIEPLVQELFLGESAFPQERGEWQFTLALQRFRTGDDRETTASLAVEYGISERLQFGITIPYRSLKARAEDDESGSADGGFEFEDDDEATPSAVALLSDGIEAGQALHELFAAPGYQRADGLADIELSMLYNFSRKETHLLSAALDVTLPTGNEDRGLGEELVEWEPALLLGANAGRLQINLAAGAALSEEDAAFTYTAAVDYACAHVVPVLELTGSLGGEEQEAYLTPGLVFNFRGNMEVNVGLSLGLTDSSADHGLSASYTLEF